MGSHGNPWVGDLEKTGVVRLDMIANALDVVRFFADDEVPCSASSVCIFQTV
jgi:hypothetical protein